MSNFKRFLTKQTCPRLRGMMPVPRGNRACVATIKEKGRDNNEKKLTGLQCGSLDAAKADRLCPACLFRTFGWGDLGILSCARKAFSRLLSFPLRQSLLCLRWSLEHERCGGGEKTQTNSLLFFLTFLFMASFFSFRATLFVSRKLRNARGGKHRNLNSFLLFPGERET